MHLELYIILPASAFLFYMLLSFLLFVLSLIFLKFALPILITLFQFVLNHDLLYFVDGSYFRMFSCAMLRIIFVKRVICSWLLNLSIWSFVSFLEFFLFSFVNVPMVYFTTEFLVRIFYYYGKMLISTCVIGDCQLYLMHMFESQIIKSVAEYVPVNGYKYSLVLLLKRLNGFWSNIVSTILHFLFVSLLPHMILWLSPIYLKCFGNSFIKLSFLLDYM